MKTSSETTFAEECTIRRIEEKIDQIIELVGKLSGLRGFGDNLIANIVGNILTK